MTCGIYLLLCESNGLHYIGQSANIERRWKEHLKLLRREKATTNRQLHRAAKKYGIETIRMIVLEVCQETSLTEREQFWLDDYRARLGAMLANAAGPADNPTRGTQLSQAHRAQISQAKLGVPIPSLRGDGNPSRRPASRLAMVGDANPAKHPAARLKMSLSSAMRRGVVSVTTGAAWDSMTKCAQDLGVSVAAVHAAATRKNPSVRGHVLARAVR